MRDHQQKGDIEVFHVSSENQLADIFTKPLDEQTFCKLRSGDHQQKGDIEVFHVSSENQLADIFTKPLDEQTFCKLRSELNVLDSRNLD